MPPIRAPNFAEIFSFLCFGPAQFGGRGVIRADFLGRGNG